MQVSQDVLAVLSRAETTGNSLKLVDQLDRQLYTRTNKVLEAAGGKWNRKAQAHLFDIEAAIRLDQIILSGSVDVPNDEFNFFPTPAAVVARVLELANVRPGMAILEPSAGRGAIAFPCVAAGATVDCYELMEANYIALATDARLRCVRHADFLTATPSPHYDVVAMNPPFARQSDVLHVLHALRFLKPGGQLVSVMSAGVTYRDNKLTRDFRDLVAQRGGFIEALPDGAFRESGTMVRSVIVSIPAEE